MRWKTLFRAFDFSATNLCRYSGGGFVGDLCKLLLAPYHELVDFAGALPDGGYPDDDGDSGNRAACMPLSTLKDRCAVGFFLRS
jgi:hypothetical protein